MTTDSVVAAVPAGVPELARTASGSVSAVHAEPVALHRAATAEQAFVVIGLSCLRHCALNRAGVLAGSSEALHQMRVGLRRLRAAFSLFKPLFTEADLAQHRAELRWLTTELGLARDYDVFLHASPGDAPTAQATELRAVLLERRQKAFAAARTAVASERATSLIAGLGSWFVSAGWGPAAGDRQAAWRAKRARSLARASLERRTKRIRKRARQLAKLEPAERHRLRVLVKKLRYGAEFFATSFPGRDWQRKRFTRRLEALQDVLGKLNDLTVQERLSVELGRGEASAGVPTVPGPHAGNRDDAAERSAPLLREAERASKRFAKAASFWR